MKAQKNSKVYWSLLKNFLNNKKIRIIPLLFYKNRFITDFQEKVKLFKFFFSKQCCIIPNNSSLTADFNYITDNRLSTVTFSAKDIGKIIPNLDSNKAHEHDNTSIRMLKICSATDDIFEQALRTGMFRSEWKKGNIASIHKTSDKKNIKNYRPVSLLLI